MLKKDAIFCDKLATLLEEETSTVFQPSKLALRASLITARRNVKKRIKRGQKGIYSQNLRIKTGSALPEVIKARKKTHCANSLYRPYSTFQSVILHIFL